MKPIEAGQLRHRITIQQNQGTLTDEAGHPIPDWQTLATVSAKVEPVGGIERWRAAQLQAETTHLVEIRYRAGITTKNRILHRNRVLEITRVNDEEERRIKLILECKEST